MNTFTRSITKVFKGAMKSFETFPASMFSAVGFVLVTMVRIQLDWSLQEPYNFLFNCLHLSFAVGTIFSLMTISFSQSIYNSKNMFITANILGIASALVTFLILYFFGGEVNDNSYGYKVVSGIWAARIGVLMLISMLAFLVIAGRPRETSDFSHSLFMTQKSFFIALLYGTVITAGASAIVGAAQVLLFNDITDKIYMYISTIGGFIGFAIFLGYFPDFRKGMADPQREDAQTQPKFIKVLFGSIMAPLMMALTVVLLLWAGKTILGGMQSSLVQLSGIAAGFSLGGIWLYIMLTHHQTAVARFYKKVYPFAAIIILVFEAWALIDQLLYSGLKTVEYNFILVWIITMAAAILLIFKRDESYKIIVAITCIVATIAVLPLLGFHSMPVRAQVNRLEALLLDEDMLKDGVLTPAAVEPERSVKEAITDAVSFLDSSQGIQLPSWYEKDLMRANKFKDTMGFEITWPPVEEFPGQASDVMSTILSLPNGTVDISNYKWVINLDQYNQSENNYVEVQGNKGLYKIRYDYPFKSVNLPQFRVELDDKVIIEDDFKEFIDSLLKTYPPSANPFPVESSNKLTSEELSLKLESPEVQVMIVFSNIEVVLDVRTDEISYFIVLDSIYINEKP